MPSLNDVAKLYFQTATGWLDSMANPPSTAGSLPTAPVDANSLSAANSTAVDHTAGAVVVTLAAPPAGLYRISARIAHAGGTPVLADVKNYEIRAAATPILKPIVGLTNEVGTIEGQYRFNGSQACSVNCIGAGTAGVRVAASLVLTKVAN